MPGNPVYTTVAQGPSVVLWIFFAVVMIMTLYYVFAEIYHWLRYGYMYPLVWIALPIYLIGIVVLVGAMLSGIALS